MARKKREVVYENGRYKGMLLDSETCQKLEALRRLDDEKGYVEDLQSIIYDLSASDVDLIRLNRSNDFVDLSKRGKLKNIQTIGVAYMYFAKRLILGDSVGMGKTVEVCGLCNLLESVYTKRQESFRFLLLTGKTLIHETCNKMIKFTGNYVQEVYGEADNVKRFITENEDDIYNSVVGAHSLVNSTLFQDYIRNFIDTKGYSPFDLVIIDEAGDILTNSGTKTYTNAKYLTEITDRIILLNATSFEKNLDQFYNQLSFVDDTLLPTKTEFSETYKVKTWDAFRGYPTYKKGAYKNQENFKQLVGYRYLARTRKSSGAKMSNCSAEVITSDLSSEQKNLLKMVSIPSMVYDCPSYFNSVGYNIPTDVNTTPKMKDLIDLLTNRLANEQSVLVYSRYKEAQFAIKRLLDEYGISCEVMNGDTPQKTRNEYINSFKLGDFKVLVTNVQKGLDFGDCNHCIFYDYDTNPNNMVQFEGRMTRSYDIIDKHVYLLISRGNELKTFKETVADDAQASDVFAGSDFSCVLSILLDDDKLKNLK